MRPLVAVFALLPLACFSEASGDDGKAADTGSSSAGGTMSSGSSSATDLSDATSADASMTASTVDTLTATTDDPSTTGADCAPGTAPIPPTPPMGNWEGPGFVAMGPNALAPCPGEEGPFGVVDIEGKKTCTCECDAPFHEICDVAFESGANCTVKGLASDGPVNAACTNFGNAVNAAVVTSSGDGCMANPVPPDGERVQVCHAEAGGDECITVIEGLRGPCFWSREGDPCPPGLDTVAEAQEPMCSACAPCEVGTYCDAVSWAIFPEFNCEGDAPPVFDDGNCHLNFAPDARSVMVSPHPDAVAPACTPSGLELEPLTVCCVPDG